MSTRKRNAWRSELVPARVGISVTPGEMLRTIRELQELTQSELADRTGIAQSNLSALETGARELGRERALVLAKALRVHPAVLLLPDFDVSEVAQGAVPRPESKRKAPAAQQQSPRTAGCTTRRRARAFYETE
jgi:transcriptional regulator with XRE-family HTH domain